MGMRFKPGKYMGKIINQGFGKAKTGTEMFFVTFEVLGIYGSDGVLYEAPPGEATCNWYLTEKAGGFFIENMRALGCPMTSFAQLDPLTDGFHNLCDVEAQFTCQENRYTKDDGSESVSEKWQFGSGSAPKAESLGSASMRKLDAMFGSALKGAGKKPLPKKPDLPKTNKPQFEQDDEANQQHVLEEAATTTRQADQDIPF